MDLYEDFLKLGLMLAFTVLGANYYQTRNEANQDARNERQWAQQRASIESDRLERLYRVQCESIYNIPFVAIESNEFDRMEKLYRLHDAAAFNDRVF